jgi:hypothetical protein
MLSLGLIDELIEFRHQMLRHFASIDRVKEHLHSVRKGDGIFSIIGLKEFGHFFEELEAFVARSSHHADALLCMKAVASELLASLLSSPVSDQSQTRSAHGTIGGELPPRASPVMSKFEHDSLLGHLKSAMEKVCLCIISIVIS